MVYEPSWNELARTTSITSLNPNEEYFFSAYAGYNEDNTVWPVAHPIELAIWGTIDLGSSTSNDCPDLDWTLLTSMSYEFVGDQG